jgi:hypothetical protein
MVPLKNHKNNENMSYLNTNLLLRILIKSSTRFGHLCSHHQAEYKKRDTGNIYRGADKFLARPTSRCILFDGENISFDASLVLYIYMYAYIYINSTNIPPIMIINRIYENQNLLSL